MTRRRFTLEEIEAALRAQAGVQAAAARALAEACGAPVPRQLVHDAVRRSKRLQEVCREATEVVLDLAEGVVLRAIQAQDLNAAKFFLETRGKHRGYTRRTELTGEAGKPIAVKDASARLIAKLDQMAERFRSIEDADAGPPETMH